MSGLQFLEIIDLDWGDDDAPEFVDGQDITNYIRAFTGLDAITAVVREAHGPGGGWPTIDVKGPLDQLDCFLTAYGQGDA